MEVGFPGRLYNSTVVFWLEQLFTVCVQPRTRLEGPDRNGEYTVAMEGVDIYNPVDNA